MATAIDDYSMIDNVIIIIICGYKVKVNCLFDKYIYINIPIGMYIFFYHCSRTIFALLRLILNTPLHYYSDTL